MLCAMKLGLMTLGALGALLLSACTLLPKDAGPERDLAIIAKFEGQMRHSGLIFLEGREPIWTAPMNESPWRMSDFAAGHLARHGEYRIGFQVQDLKVVADNGYFLAPVNPNALAVVKKKTETKSQTA